MAINLDLLRHFISRQQLSATRNFTNEELKEVGERIQGIIERMPKTYGQENVKADDKIVYLHYFKGGSDWYIVEKDSEEEQIQAFGYAILNGDEEMAEWGYVSIEELIRLGVELDFYFTPKKFSEVMEKKSRTAKAVSEINDMFTGKKSPSSISGSDVAVAPSSKDAFIYGEQGYGVPSGSGKKLIDALEGFGFYISDITKHSFGISYPNDKTLIINDNGGEFNIIDKELDKHVDNVAYDTNKGLLSAYQLALAIEQVYMKENREKMRERVVAQIPSTETHTETEILESEIKTEEGAAPLENIELQNAQIKDLSYIPQSDSCKGLDTSVPSSLRYDMHKAVETVDRRVNGVDEYVAEKLGYIVGNCSIEQRKEGLKCLCNAFGAEQVDAIAMAIYNIDNGNGIIIGDQAGIGKGRMAAAILRYGIKLGLRPIFITEKPNLFSDIYRDLLAIGSDDAIPVEVLTGFKEVEKKLIKTEPKAEEEDNTAEEEDNTAEEEDNTEIERVDVYAKNKKYPTYTRTWTDAYGSEQEEIRVGKKFVRPFIINGRISGNVKTDIKDEFGNILYKADLSDIQNAIVKRIKTDKVIGTNKNGSNKYEWKNQIGTFTVPDNYDIVLATYSQFNKVGSIKSAFLSSIAKGNIIVMDESHNASGDSNVGRFLMNVLSETKGVVFLSATYAKRPDNMPIYASKTALREASLSSDELTAAIISGGLALQEVIASNLTSEGQYIKRQRSYEGIEVNYEYLDASQTKRGFPHLDLEQKHRAIMDNTTKIIREIMNFQKDYIEPIIDEMDEIAAKEYKQTNQRKGTSKAGVDSPPIFSGVFNLINQLLFSIKAEAAAEVAIQRLKEGKKPVVAFANTMEGFLDTLTTDEGVAVEVGDIINSDFSVVLKKRLDSVLRYTVTDANGNKEYQSIDIYEQDEQVVAEYNRILNLISHAALGISCSPIDVVADKIRSAGYSVIEVTGRNRELKMLGNNTAQLKSKKKIATNDAYRMFNDNEVDCLLVNQSGSTGASGHAIVTKKVPLEQVKQRVMIILQTELNVNTEVQKRGRINRTGQVLKPIYDYVISAIPAEKRLMMMLQKKLKSLDSNTASNQEESSDMVDSSNIDFLDKYGDQVVYEYMVEKISEPKTSKLNFNETIGDPLKLGSESKEGSEESNGVADAASKVSGRVAILSCTEQEDFYKEIALRYTANKIYLKEASQWDLEVEKLELEAETISKDVVIVGKGGNSVFGRHSILEKVSVKNIKKPYLKNEIDLLIQQSIGDFRDAYELRDSIIEKCKMFFKVNAELALQELKEKYASLKQKIKEEPQAKKSKNLQQYIRDRTEELTDAEEDSIKKLKVSSQNKFELIYRVLNYFHVGRIVGYPSITYEFDGEYSKAVFLGFQINENVKNPFARSAIKARFAVGSSLKYIAVPLSKSEVIDKIIYKITPHNILNPEYIFENWNKIVQEKTTDRVTRYIVTGNVLQAFGNPDLKGSLTRYTTSNGGEKVGILLPDGFSPNSRGTKKAMDIIVPIIYALPLIKALSVDRSITTKDGIVFWKSYDYNFKIVVPANQIIGGKFYMDDSIRQLVDNGNFEKSGANMVARLQAKWLETLVEYLQRKFNSTVSLTPSQFELIKDSIEIKDYADEERQPEPEVFLEKLTEVDKQEAAKRQQEEAQKQFESEQKKRELEIAEQEEQKRRVDALAMEERKMAMKKKLLNVWRLLNKQEIEMAKGGEVEKDLDRPSPKFISDSLKAIAYNLGVEAHKKGTPRVPAQNAEFMEFLSKSVQGKAGAEQFKHSTEVMKAFENGYHNEVQKELRVKFPKMFKPHETA